jgi:hypothetical protein
MRVTDEAGIWRFAQTLKDFGIPEDAASAALAALKLGNWVTDLSQLKDPGGFLTSTPELLTNSLFDIGNKITMN